MDRQEIRKRKLTLDDCTHLDDNGVEYWFAREIQEVFGYTQWRNFEEAMKRAMVSMDTSETPVQDHFAEVSKMVPLGSGSERRVKDYMLTRYACYLIAQNGDPSSFFRWRARRPSRRWSTSSFSKSRDAGAPKRLDLASAEVA